LVGTNDPLDQYAPDLDYGVTYPPTLNDSLDDRAKYFWEGWNYGIPVGSKQPKEAWSFIKYAFHDHSDLMGAVTLNGATVRAQLQSWQEKLTEVIGASDRMTPYLHILTEVAEASTKAWPTIAAASRYTDEIARAEDYAIRGAKTAQAALDECAETVQKELDAALNG
jgi:multiple sugar transport system substrate-binding protein